MSLLIQKLSDESHRSHQVFAGFEDGAHFRQALGPLLQSGCCTIFMDCHGVWFVSMGNFRHRTLYDGSDGGAMPSITKGISAISPEDKWGMCVLFVAESTAVATPAPPERLRMSSVIPKAASTGQRQSRLLVPHSVPFMLPCFHEFSTCAAQSTGKPGFCHHLSL